MLVSVIIPAYNVEKYISACLDSVLCQEYKNIEIVCIDDCSTDGTYLVLKEYKEKHPSIILFRNSENRGSPYTRNVGLSNATGQYIQFLDADDILLPKKISLQIESIHQAGYIPDIVVGYCIWKQSDGTETTHYFTYDVWMDLVLNSLGDTCSNLWNALAIKKVGGWTEDLKSSQEADLMLRMLKNNAAILYHPVANTIVRQQKSGSVSSYNRFENLTRYLNVRVEVLKFLSKNNKLSASVSYAISKQLFFGARELITLDEFAGLQLFEKYVPVNFPYYKNSGVNFIYKTFYFLLGFKRTELLLFLLKKYSRKL